MWTVSRTYQNPAALQLRFLCDGADLSYARFLQALAGEADFRNLLINELVTAPFTAFRWETPPVNNNTLDRVFECLLHDSPDLDVSANPTDFEAYFEPRNIVCFDNLGADALLVVPCPTDPAANYSHIASFHRTAAKTQQHALWEAVAESMLSRIGAQPLWLSTAGGGVDWLHVRLDQRPKYYRYTPWRTAPGHLG